MSDLTLPTTLETFLTTSRTRNRDMTLFPGTVLEIDTNDPTNPVVLVDGSDAESRIPYLRGLPSLAVDTRVMVAFYPPQGAIIIGVIGGTDGSKTDGTFGVGDVTLGNTAPGTAISDVLTITPPCSIIQVFWSILLSVTAAAAAGTVGVTWCDEDADGTDIESPDSRIPISFTGTTTLTGNRVFLNTPAGKQFQMRARKSAGAGGTVATVATNSRLWALTKT